MAASRTARLTNRRETNMNQNDQSIAKALAPGIIAVFLITCFFMWGCPQYQVYDKTLTGEAELKQAEWNRQITVKEAEAKLEAAKSLAKAEVERSKGVAEANKIIGDSLKGNESYLHYLWIHNLENTQNQVVYIPTEANMPILERRK